MTAIWTWIKTFFAWMAGSQAGEAAARAAQTQETANAETRIAAAENTAPADRGAVVRHLHRGNF